MKERHSARNMFYKTCATCRANTTLCLHQKRAQAAMHGKFRHLVLVTTPLRLHNTGQRYCVAGSHQVSLHDCTSGDGALRTSCRGCLRRWRDERHAALEATAAAAVQHPEVPADENWHNGDVDGVEVAQFDEFDNVFGDGSDLMDVDLPLDSALSRGDAALLNNLNKKMDEIDFSTCDDCLEEGFDLTLVDGTCSRCRRDTGHPVRKWSAANNVHPGRPFICPLTLSLGSLPKQHDTFLHVSKG
jgi:hypothetical protein